MGKSILLDTILQGDAQELGKKIPSNSVDIIITDPPYKEEYLPLYSWLARFAKRVLKDGSYLICYGPGSFMPEVFGRLNTVFGLDYFWMEPLIHNGGYPRVWNKHLMSAYKPIFVYTKGKPKLLPWRATVHSDQQDKRFHEWGQGVGMGFYFLELLTNPGELLLDPFAGGGNFLAAAKMTGRKYLGFEIDLDKWKIAIERLASEPKPLFVLPRQEKQLKMDFVLEEPDE